MTKLFYVLIVGLSVYVLMVLLGRQLRSRWAMRLGAPYHLICIANAVLAAAYFMQLPLETYRVIMAAAYMMDALLLLTLFNRLYWEDYFQRKRNIVVPRFFTHATRLVGITTAVLLILQFIFEVRVPGLFASLAGGGVVIGLALRPVISNLTAGLTIQLGKPLKQGDWLLIDNRLVEVMELNWRTSRLRTVDHTYLEIPNVDLVNAHLQNFSYPTPHHAVRATVSTTRFENSDESGAGSAYNARPQAGLARVAGGRLLAKNTALRRITPTNSLDTHEVAQNRLRCSLPHPRHA